MSKTRRPTDASVILTYRCPMRCQMCNIWQHPTRPDQELRPDELKWLPKLKFINLTGGEPFVRDDLEQVVSVCYTRAPRIVISTSGWFEDRVVALARKFPNIGIRISIEGLSQANDALRGRAGGFDRGLRTLLTLRRMGLRDIGFGCTVSDSNSADMLALYDLARQLGLEFATATVHNSFYFHKHDNAVEQKQQVVGHFVELVDRQLREQHPKSWFRAYFNMGLARYVLGKPRLLPCEAGTANFFIDPWGEVWPCNGLEQSCWQQSMGNLRQSPDFDTLWDSPQAQAVRRQVASCTKQCWMVGTASPVMHRYLARPAAWALRNKWRSLRGLPPKLDL